MIFDTFQNAVQPVIVDLLMYLTLGALAWLLRRLPERFRLDIEARHREALHKALNTAVGLVFDTVQRDPRIAASDYALTKGVEYVRRSVPQAIRRLGPSQAQLEEMMRAKIQLALDEAIGRDRLAEALKQAGA